MEKCLFSKYTKPDAMDSIKTDIVRYNKIKWLRSLPCG